MSRYASHGPMIKLWPGNAVRLEAIAWVGWAKSGLPSRPTYTVGVRCVNPDGTPEDNTKTFDTEEEAESFIDMIKSFINEGF